MDHLHAQTALLVKMAGERRSEPASQTLRNVIRITPHINWPILGDDDQKVDWFISQLESTIGLANDSNGMQPAETLITFGQYSPDSRSMS